MHVWYKSVPANHADAWAEALAEFVERERVAVARPVNRTTARVEVYCATARRACALAQKLGGRTRAVAPESWQPSPANSRNKTLAIGGRLWVTGREDELPAIRAVHPGKPALCVPAAMAFGTGEHATTAMCLRLLAEVSKPLAGKVWSLLDLGTGSGILALAGKLFGARTVLGLENDPVAVRIAKENATLNSIRGVQFKRADLIADWTPKPGAWQVVMANLFSELHIALAAKMARTLAPGGYLIASGVLATQAAEVEAAFAKRRLRVVEKRKRGKWVAFLTEKTRGGVVCAVPSASASLDNDLVSYP